MFAKCLIRKLGAADSLRAGEIGSRLCFGELNVAAATLSTAEELGGL